MGWLVFLVAFVLGWFGLLSPGPGTILLGGAVGVVWFLATKRSRT